MILDTWRNFYKAFKDLYNALNIVILVKEYSLKSRICVYLRETEKD